MMPIVIQSGVMLAIRLAGEVTNTVATSIKSSMAKMLTTCLTGLPKYLLANSGKCAPSFRKEIIPIM